MTSRRRAAPRRDSPLGGQRSTRSDKRGGHIPILISYGNVVNRYWTPGASRANLSTMSDELCMMTATELRERIARREVSPVDVTTAVLDRAQRLQPALNCFITICADE